MVTLESENNTLLILRPKDTVRYTDIRTFNTVLEEFRNHDKNSLDHGEREIKDGPFSRRQS